MTLPISNQLETGSNIMPQKKYEPRPTKFLETWNEKNWSFKSYEIQYQWPKTDLSPYRPAIVDAARERTKSLLPALEAEGSHHNLGFAILHCGSSFNWLLIHWWVHQCICSEILARSKLETPEEFEIVKNPLMACVWELTVINFERNAWVETMMIDAPSPQKYLERHLSDGYY